MRPPSGTGGASPIGGGANASAIVDDGEIDNSVPPDPNPAMPVPPSNGIPVPDPDPGFGTPPAAPSGTVGGAGASVVGGTSSSAVALVYTWGAAGLVSERLNPGQAGAYSRWYHYGPQGETRYLTYADGSRTTPFAYTAFGVPVLSPVPVTTNPFRFGGQVGYYTTPSGLILCGSRWYDPEIGRWVSRDPSGYGGGPNLYE